MTRREAERLTHQENVLLDLGFTRAEAESLRRISMTLHRWAEHECNGNIERKEDENDRPYWSSPNAGRHYICRVPDREKGALKRLQDIISARNERAIVENGGDRSDVAVMTEAVNFYVQGDPRGSALYILRPGDVPDGKSTDSYYTRGIAIY
jgi:hypothetical protein